MLCRKIRCSREVVIFERIALKLSYPHRAIFVMSDNYRASATKIKAVKSCGIALIVKVSLQTIHWIDTVMVY